MSSNPYKPLNPAELIESAKDDPIQYIVDGLLPTGSLNMLAGKPKSGKSTLVRQLAACVASGDDFLGRTTTKGNVLYSPAKKSVLTWLNTSGYWEFPRQKTAFTRFSDGPLVVSCPAWVTL
jgi:AAA domain